MPSVYLCSPTNSTMFTTCCRVAILNSQANCPRCNSEITPRDARGRWEKAFGPCRRLERQRQRRNELARA
jgi:transcription initiation factor IIE alpha subunit